MKVLKVIGIILLILAAVTVARYIASEAVKSTQPSEDSYMGFNRQEYLNQVSNNGQDTASLCAYTYLIDRYGLKETYNMDYRAYKDENDVDERIFKAIEMCME